MPSARHAAPALLVLSLTVSLVACGGGGESTPPGPADPVTNPVDPATAATVTGRVTLTGKAPAPQPITMAADPRCIKAVRDA